MSDMFDEVERISGYASPTRPVEIHTRSAGDVDPHGRQKLEVRRISHAGNH
jgi:hypothetical protein